MTSITKEVMVPKEFLFSMGMMLECFYSLRTVALLMEVWNRI